MRAETGWKLLRFIVTALAMFAVWLLFTASFNLFSITAGIIGALIIAALTYNVFIAQHETALRSFLFRPFYLPIFLILLLIYFYGSSVKMLGAVFSGRVNPRIVHFRTRLRSDLARMVLANSITFTPGTITLDLNDDHLTVHWFFSNTRHAKAAGEAIKGRMEKQIRRIWQ